MESGVVGTIWLDPYSAAEFCNGGAQHFVVLDRRIMLVQRVDDHYERRGLGILSFSEETEESGRRDQRTRRLVGQFGVLEHIKLQ